MLIGMYTIIALAFVSSRFSARAKGSTNSTQYVYPDNLAPGSSGILALLPGVSQ